MRPGLVIGNGESRLALPLADLIASGAYEVAACNKAATRSASAGAPGAS